MIGNLTRNLIRTLAAALLLSAPASAFARPHAHSLSARTRTPQRHIHTIQHHHR